MACYLSDSDSEFEGFSQEDLLSVNERVDFLSEDGLDISISPVSTPDISEDESDDKPVASVWSSNLRSFEVKEFSSNAGATFDLGPGKNERDFFQKFFPDHLVQGIVLETNNYATRMIADKADPKWYPTTLAEMYAFLGIFVIFSIMQIPKFSIAWNTASYFGLPGVPDMTRERFEKLCKYLHVNDSQTNPPRGTAGHDKLHHIRPVYDVVNSLSLENYDPPQAQSIDEGMIAYKGRLSFKQYLPAKPTKFGIKVWERAHPKTGYVHEFQVYVGKPDSLRGQRVTEEGLGTRVVKDLTRNIRGKYHHIYMDNFFSSPKLFEDLLLDDIYCCGTVRCNRKGLPESLKKPREVTKQGDMKSLQKDTMICVAWKDKKLVHLLFNNMDPNQLSHVTRRQKDGQTKDVRCPKVADVYSKHKGGVDIADQNRMQYTTARKAKKWWKYLFWFLFDTALCNALVCMKESPNHRLKTKSGKSKKRTHIDFRMNLARQLVAGFIGSRKRRAPSNLDSEGTRHWPTKFPKRDRCVNCSKEGRRHEVLLGCKQCQKHLCVDHDCFEKYHTQLLKS